MVYYHVGKAGDKFPAGMLREKTITHDKNGELVRPDNGDTLVFTTTLGKNHYVNITVLDAEKIKSMGDSKWEPSMADGYFIYKYEINGDKLTIAGMDPTKKKTLSRPEKSKAKAKIITVALPTPPKISSVSLPRPMRKNSSSPKTNGRRQRNTGTREVRPGCTPQYGPLFPRWSVGTRNSAFIF